jgi:hypothetical protein
MAKNENFAIGLYREQSIKTDTNSLDRDAGEQDSGLVTPEII